MVLILMIMIFPPIYCLMLRNIEGAEVTDVDVGRVVTVFIILKDSVIVVP